MCKKDGADQHRKEGDMQGGRRRLKEKSEHASRNKSSKGFCCMKTDGRLTPIFVREARTTVQRGGNRSGAGSPATRPENMRDTGRKQVQVPQD